jgi:4'-phosphopantetheinyl transferase
MNSPIYWLIQRSEDVPEKEDWLSEAERDVLAGFRFAKRRNDWRLGRWTAKRAVRAYHALKDPAPARIEIRAAEDGAPEAFQNEEPDEISISISHSNGCGFCAVGPRDFSVGCDTEKVEPREVQFFQDYFALEEIDLLNNAPAERSLVAYLIWCAKESVLKSLRQGLRLDTRSVIVRPDFRDPVDAWNAWTARLRDTPQMFHGWWQSQNGFIYAMTAKQITPPPRRLLVY